jgi:hypothetical protein
MMNVAEFIDFLKQFPQDAEVYVGVNECFRGELTDRINHEPFRGEDGVEFVDFTTNPFVKQNHPFFGKKVVFLGECF